MAEDITNNYLALITPGFTGADIQNIVNMALIDAIDSGSTSLQRKHFQEAIDRVIIGIKYKYRKPKNLRYLLQRAIHESGHTLVCYKNEICRSSLHKASISTRGGSDSTTSIMINQEDMDDTKEELKVLIDVSVAGIIAEELYFGESKISTGCGKDINKAYHYATMMVKKFGMSPLDFGYMVIKEQHFEHKIARTTRNLTDTAASNLINSSSNKIRELLNQNMGDLLKLTHYLLEYEELDKNDIINILEKKENEFKRNKLRQVSNLKNIKI
jgi:ATP-dependent Zn protease